MKDRRDDGFIKTGRLWVAGAVALALFLLFDARLAWLQVFDSKELVGKAKLQSRRLVILPAPRGEIKDRHGRLVVGNRPAINIVADITRLKPEFDRKYDELLRNDHAWLVLNASLDGLKYKTDAERGKLRAEARKRSRELYENAAARVLQARLDEVNLAIGRSETVNVAAVSAHLSRDSGRRALKFTLARDLDAGAAGGGEFARFIEKFPPGGPVSFAHESVRVYPYGNTAAHVLGYVGSDRYNLSVPELDPDTDAEAAEFAGAGALSRRRLLKASEGQRGVDGVEKAFDDELRGENGYELWKIRRDGYAYELVRDPARAARGGGDGGGLVREPPRQGGTVTLSLDIEFQKAVEEYLARRFPAHRSSVVVLDVPTGEVLVCANSPGYDPARMSVRAYRNEYLREYDERFNERNKKRVSTAGELERLLAARAPDDPSPPPRLGSFVYDAAGRHLYEPPGEGAELNHATQGLYPPGSSFKPVTAIAALRSTPPDPLKPRITPETIYQCGSFLEVKSGRSTKMFIEHNRIAYGAVNLVKMLKVSSNVYCYQAGLDIGFDNLVNEARRFGLGERTTLELPSLAGSVPSRKRGRGFTESDIANTAVGQGDVLVSPMHLAAMIASVARNRTRTAVSIRHSPDHEADNVKVLAGDDGKPKRVAESGLLRTAAGGLVRDERKGVRFAVGEPIGLPAPHYQAVIDGLIACAHERGGTGRRVTEGLPDGFIVAAKTGTAQVKNNTAELAWTIGFAPAGAPRIAFAVLVEGEDGNKHFAGGANAGPVANFVLAKWLELENAVAAPPTARETPADAAAQ
ncbi:MAG: hypothetical protein LBR07_08155 [Puniceicoccales bacterium]|jgi:penicillin-binding protein 2|nr:hypothetical protein [Puniceicoccales bacterium]